MERVLESNEDFESGLNRLFGAWEAEWSRFGTLGQTNGPRFFLSTHAWQNSRTESFEAELKEDARLNELVDFCADAIWKERQGGGECKNMIEKISTHFNDGDRYRRFINLVFVRTLEKASGLENPDIIMHKRILSVLGNPQKRLDASNDFTYTYEQLGLSEKDAAELAEKTLDTLGKPNGLKLLEELTRRYLTQKLPDFSTRIDTKMEGRADLIFSQIAPYLQGLTGHGMDYGTGDGQVAQRIKDQLGLDIEGLDVRDYRAPCVTIPIKIVKPGKKLDMYDGAYQFGVATNVLHHESDNQKIIDELSRLVSDRLVILETVPMGESESEMEADKDRTFMNDFLYNRIFHNANVPVPGTFETPAKWKERFAAAGWECEFEEDLGNDQPTIRDRHYLMVFKKNDPLQGPRGKVERFLESL